MNCFITASGKTKGPVTADRRPGPVDDSDYLIAQASSGETGDKNRQCRANALRHQGHEIRRYIVSGMSVKHYRRFRMRHMVPAKMLAWASAGTPQASSMA